MTARYAQAAQAVLMRWWHVPTGLYSRQQIARYAQESCLVQEIRLAERAYPYSQRPRVVVTCFGGG